uniref:Protein-serine/threonine kinase n=1 Tax=Odontella aurita TaxID=265563 RepID=A0A7S4JG74_9STRA|mmetsp:Transcript_45602/g.138578  ORF Transcript_45602/g.138578 Transcript_45602/m.138578 type:complete len:515 (+) Transcript_45602:179-1723(+)
MQRLTPSVRSSLVAEAAEATQSAIHRWSLQSLAAVNGGEIPDTLTPKQFVGKPKGYVRNHAAEVLLNDIRLRLAGQHDKVAKLLAQARDLLDDPLPVGASDSVVAGVSRRGVVKAINNPVGMNMKQWTKDLEEADLIQGESIRLLENLEVCHVDTYHLAHQLLPPGDGKNLKSRPDYLSRWSGADRAMVEAVFEQIRSRHASSVETLAEVAIGLRRCRSLRNGDGHVLQPGYFCGIDLALIDAFLKERLGVQLLCDHYVSLDKGKASGGISVDCDLWDVLDDAVTEARHLCDANLGIAPEVNVDMGLMKCFPFDEQDGILGEPVDESIDKSKVNLTLIRPWVHHALVEVLKNAMGSSVKRALRDNPGEAVHPPDVHVRIVNTEHYFSIIIIDNGAGLDKDSAVRAFRFGDSSSPRRWDRLDEQQTYAMVRAPLGSLGVGLPLSRMMLRMFGGNLILSNRFSPCSIAEEEAGNSGDLSGCVAALKVLKDDGFIEGNSPPLFSAGDSDHTLRQAHS